MNVTYIHTHKCALKRYNKQKYLNSVPLPSKTVKRFCFYCENVLNLNCMMLQVKQNRDEMAFPN